VMPPKFTRPVGSKSLEVRQQQPPPQEQIPERSMPKFVPPGKKSVQSAQTQRATKIVSYKAGKFMRLRNELFHADLSTNAKVVYLGLARYANAKTQTCHPQIATLALALGVSTKTVQRSLGELLKANVIGKRERFKGGTQLSNEYMLLDPSVWDVKMSEPED
jgi:hypothetical protein